MITAVKKTISLPLDLAEEIERMSVEEGKSVSSIVQDALRAARRERLKSELGKIQGYWSKKAIEKGILTEKELERHIKK